MGSGIVALCPFVEGSPQPSFSFSTSSTFSPSSFKAESFAIYLALISSPPSSSVIIYTDSESAIATYNSFIIRNSSSPRQWLKLKCHSLWKLIKYVIKINQLTCQLIYVKAHSGVEHNESADRLAKAAASNSAISHCTYNFRLLPSSL